MTYTLGDLKTRIRLETNRDDIASGGEAETALTTAIDRAIEHYASEAFWFNTAGAITAATANTTATIGYVAIPAAVRVPQVVSFSGEELQKVELEDIEALTDTGQPTRWAENGDNIQLWPIPDTTYTLNVFGTARIAAPTLDADSTVWTNEAYDLIAARVRFLLFRDLWRDVEGTQLAAQAEGEAFSRLRRETRRRNITPLRSTGTEPWGVSTTFNINRGDY